ncbi:response regulator transcription factor [Pseudomonas eucalypticola]|uniref:Response regulator transcription factor n=1 Tax=Pseudomonas eucalypticola TaxID=2599595 RepID=A0A7D5H5A9_9PSED|nr:response regulator transcription factor [Pseudomonas eucalypticola]QKZ03384.1 response regulator transcription factor [Pseudomonas eucalypticola]
MHILVIEDDLVILDNITRYLTRRGYIVDCAENGAQGLELARTGDFDLIVLDLMLPRLDGYTLCRHLREQSGRRIPVIMVTARDTLENRLEGFEAGADDYLVKPFALAELAARVNAVLLRASPAQKAVLQVGDLYLDTTTLALTRAGQALKLPPAPLRLLMALMQASPAVVARRKLEELLWHDSPPDSDSLRTHIHQLRHVVDKPFPHALLRTVHGIGYRLAADA